jgi:hypothetical protein
MPIPQERFILDGLEFSRRRFLYGLDQTPDERLTWTPGETTKTALHIAASLAQFMTLLANSLTGQETPSWDVESLPPAATREAAEEAINSACAAVRRAVEGLEPGDLAAKPPPPGINDTVEGVLWWITATIMYHQGQLNYIQLCYGDGDVNIPPSEGS